MFLLFDCCLFWVSRPFETVFQSISDRLPETERNSISVYIGPSPRERKKREKIDEIKYVQTTSTRPFASVIGPTIIRTRRTPRQ